MQDTFRTTGFFEFMNKKTCLLGACQKKYAIFAYNNLIIYTMKQ